MATAGNTANRAADFQIDHPATGMAFEMRGG
jgi:hypothetical protein